MKDFRWHDLRHTWASWHVQRCTPLLVLKELRGWETIEMLQKYARAEPRGGPREYSQVLVKLGLERKKRRLRSGVIP
ncbi:tyrosine-type recombinase/integrase [Paraburkholderia graminis]|jgi:integrase|uniref:tyrosine-type recombinase/integrase n=1 Tax=Paraburkholderia graminis TaxID=60548 RepID=UPI003D310B63